MVTAMPKPSGSMVYESTFTGLAVEIGHGRHVIYTYADARITISVEEQSGPVSRGQGGWCGRLSAALRTGAAIGELAVTADVSCGGGAEFITTHGSPAGIAAVRTALPDLHGALRDPAERAAVRAIHRHLTKLADRPARGDAAVRKLEHGVSLTEVADEWCMTPTSLGRSITIRADEQQRFGHITDERHAAITALVGIRPPDVERTA